MDLDAIEQRTRAATEGPWDAEETADCIRITRDHVPALVARVKELEEENARLRKAAHDAFRLGLRLEDQPGTHTTLTARIAQLEAELADARAEARREADDSQAHADDVPGLVARVRELEEALASVRELIDGHRLGTDRLIPGTELEAALERARENGGTP